MPELITDILQSLPPWALALAAAVLAMLVMLLLKRLIVVRIGKLIEQTPFQIDTLLVHALRLPLTLLVYRLVLSQLEIEAGALISFNLAPVPDERAAAAAPLGGSGRCAGLLR